MDEALEFLIALVEGGTEYPDAEWLAVKRFGVNADELRAMYDEKDAK